MEKKRIKVKDKKVRGLIKEGSRKNAREDFFELLKRATHSS